MLNTRNEIRPIRLTDEQLKSLLDQLDGARAEPATNARGADRITYRTLKLTVHVLTGQDQVASSFQVPSRNISASGLAFLHKQMLPVGQRLKIEIPMVDDRVLHVQAGVARCRHVQGMIHEVGVQFQGLVE